MRNRLVISGVACLVTAAGATAQVRSMVAGPSAMPVAASLGVEQFVVQAPDAVRSAASRLNTDLADKAGRTPPPTPGYILTDGVVIRSDDAAAVHELTGGTAMPLRSAPGFWLYRAGSIRLAADAAARLRTDPRISEAYLDIEPPHANRSVPTDPGLNIQWHFRNLLIPLADSNIEAAWEMGYTGAGVTIGILEGGWQTNHPDLAANFNSEASEPGGSATAHGTAVAGVAAAAANNVGGVGAAFGASLSQLIKGTASRTADAFGHRNDLNHIKNNSWGPLDNGYAHSIPSIERAALEQAIAEGRGGKGTIFVWAAGNGGEFVKDRCDYDPYVSSRYTIAVGAVGDQDRRAAYNETGSSMFVVSHSSGNVRGIYTTDVSGPGGYVPGDFYNSFGGTSSASPLVAGVIALMLEANPDLTWRDVQHILVRSARVVDPADPLWVLNGAGRPVNYNYGFGAVDAGAAVALAEGWRNVAPERVVSVGPVTVGATLPEGDPAGLTSTVVVPENLRVEAVEVVFNATTPFVGDLKITLTSPSGAESLLAATRTDPTDDYVNYLFTTVRHWDEGSAGQWTLRVADLGTGDTAEWHDWTLKVYGTPKAPTPSGGSSSTSPASVRRVPPP